MKYKSLLNKVIDYVIVILFIFLFIVVLLQIFFRYVLNSPLTWSEELSRYIFIWIALLGWTLASRNNTHIKINFVIDALPNTYQFIVKIISYLIILFFIGALIYLGIVMAWKSTNVPTVSLFFTFAYIYAAVPVTASVILIYTIIEIIELFRKQGEKIQ